MDTGFNSLVDNIVKGKCALFLGAGASATSILNSGEKSPLGNSLAAKIYEYFYPDDKYENESLALTCSLVTKSQGPDKLRFFLLNYFNNIQPSEGLQSLTKFKWKNIYTTNIETALENAYQITDDKAQNIKVVVGPKDVSSTDRLTEVTLYKLHGCITRPDVGIVFSLEEYATTKENHLRLFYSLSNDLIESNMIFIGYSMADSNFQDTWNTIKNYCKVSNAPNKYYFVSPYLKRPWIEFLMSEGFVVFDMGVDEFAENLMIHSREVRVPLEEYYKQNLKPISVFETINLTAESKFQISKNYDFPFLEVRSPYNKSSSFYRGNVSSWGDVKHKLDAGRDLFEELWQAFNNWCASPKFDLWLITGRAGDGKSMLLKRFAYEVSLQFNDTTLFAKPKADLDAVRIIEFYKEINLPLVIFIDDTTDRIPKVNRLISFIKSEKAKILLIGCTRASDWGVFNKDFYVKPVEFSIGRLSDEEIRRILEKLKENASLGYLAELSEQQRFSFFKEKSERELLVALREATLNKNFDEIIANEFANIRSEEAQQAYLIICLIYQFRYRIPQSLLIRVLGYSLSDIYSKLFKYTEEIIFLDESQGEDDYLLRARHSVIAQTVVSYYLKGDVPKFDLLEKLLVHHTPSSKLEKSLVKKVYHHSTIKQLFIDPEVGVRCYEMLAEQVPADYFILQQKAIFLSDYLNDYSGAKAAILEAQNVSEDYYEDIDVILRNTEGTILLNEALDTEDYMASKYLMEKGKNILRSIIKHSRFKNNSYNHHSLINHLISWYDRFKREDSQILEEIQTLIDDALRKYPNDHLILTECGKVEKLLNHTTGAISYFEQAVSINPRNHSARYLLAKSLIHKERYQEAFNVCSEGMEFTLNNLNLNRLRFEILHKVEKDISVIKSEYNEYLFKNPEDDYLKLVFAAFLYVMGDNNCDKLFQELRKIDRISLDEKYVLHHEISRHINIDDLIESGKEVRVVPSGFYVSTNRFQTNTLCFLQRWKKNDGRRVGRYRYTFNYGGPFILALLD